MTNKKAAPSRLGIQQGLTLVEVLVVLLLSAFITTLLIQGVGHVLKAYSVAERVQQNTATRIKQQFWFQEVVSGLIPYSAKARKFVGGETLFSGYSSTPLAKESGMPTPIVWKLQSIGGHTQLLYGESGSKEWQIASFYTDKLHFVYQSREGEWYESWPVSQGSLLQRQKIPQNIAVVDESGERYMMATSLLYPEMVQDFQRAF